MSVLINGIRVPDEVIDAAARAIADTRLARWGRPGVGDIDWLPFEYREQLKEEAAAGIAAAVRTRLLYLSY